MLCFCFCFQGDTYVFAATPDIKGAPGPQGREGEHVSVLHLFLDVLLSGISILYL